MHYEISKPKKKPSCSSKGNNPEQHHRKIIDYIYLRLTTLRDYVVTINSYWSMRLQHKFNIFYNLKGSVKIDPLISPYNNTSICHHLGCNFYTESVFCLYWSLSLPNERKKKLLKTIIAARAEATTVLSSGRLNMNAITNTIPAATRAKGIQYFMASEDRPSFLTLLQLYSWYHIYLIYYTTVRYQ